MLVLIGFPVTIDLSVGQGGIDLDTGRVQYVDFETNAPITDGNLLAQASARDGFRFFSGSNEVVWKIDRTEIPTRNRNNGVNFIDERASNVQIDGSGNYVSGLAVNTTIQGDSNDLIEVGGNIQVFGNNVSASGSINGVFVVNNASGSSVSIASGSEGIVAFNPTQPITELDNGRTIIGNAKLEGNQYEDYFNVSVSAGSTTYLTGSQAELYFHHHFQWSGGNGTANVYIPSASLDEYDGIKMRFTTDNGLTASKIVNLIPSDGTIDGGAEKSLTTPYDGLTAQVINGEWLVIQEKAK